MDLQPHDLHFMYSEAARQLKCFDPTGSLIWQAECRNSTVNNGTYGYFGNCPPGEFVLARPQVRHTVPFGFYFTLICDYNGHTAMQHWGRGGIGIHGGGSGLADPFAPRQGWQITEGCLRLQNCDNGHFVQIVEKAQAAGGRCYLTVAP